MMNLHSSTGLACAVVFPKPPETCANDLSLRKTLKDTRNDMNVILFVVALMCIGFNDATFAVHLKTAVSLLIGGFAHVHIGSEGIPSADPAAAEFYHP